MAFVVAVIAERVQGPPTVVIRPKNADWLDKLKNARGSEVWYIEGEVEIEDEVLPDTGYYMANDGGVWLVFWGSTRQIGVSREVVTVDGIPYIFNIPILRT
jgi:hypothetical protein